MNRIIFILIASFASLYAIADDLKIITETDETVWVDILNEIDCCNEHGPLNEDVVHYASLLYFQGKHFESINWLSRLHTEDGNTYWLWKNEVALTNLLMLDDLPKKHKSRINDYIKSNRSFFVYEEALGGYVVSKLRLKQSEKVYPNNEFLNEMQQYYFLINNSLKIKLKKPNEASKRIK